MTAPSEAASDPVPTGNHFDKYGATNPLSRLMLSRFLDALDTLLPVAAPTRVLEVGMGEGEIVRRLRERWPQADITGVDLWDDELRTHWADLPAAAVVTDARRLPFPDDSFDLVLAIEVLEHVERPGLALAELARVGTDRVIVSVPREPIWRAANMARGSYLRDLGNTPGHINHWSSRGFRNFVGGVLDIDATAQPFPWTMVSASVGHHRSPTATG
ncbi:MAG: class I SAM-dependent methyltransferase [Acidimicrobiales bacterium]